MEIEDEQGWVIVATNTDDIDYIACARVLAKSLRYFHPDARICIISDREIDDPIFDYSRVLVNPQGGFLDDWQVFRLSPFRESIKLEADMIVTSPIDHWWDMFSHREVCIATGARDFYGNRSTARDYRKVFDLNGLPDVYNAITYWRVSVTAQEFFKNVNNILNNWDIFKQTLTGASNEPPTTDLAYAIAITMFDVEQFTLPSSYPSLIHMKSKILGIAADDWRKQLTWELLDDGSFRINTVVQNYPVHYHQKDFAQELEPIYDKLLGCTNSD